MRLAIWFLAGMLFLMPGVCRAQTQPRLALIIGNADYDLNGRIELSEAAENAAKNAGRQPDLANPVNDARDMRDALLALGFDVSSYLENATKLDMISAIDAFGRKIAAAGPNAIVLVYYSGHGMQIEGENFLIPAGAQLVGADFDHMSAPAMQAILSGVAVPTSFLRAQLRPRAGDGVNIIVLDACRSNPWDPAKRGGGGRGRGLADQDWGLGQTLIAFSTAPGTTAYDGGPDERNSPYTAALRALINTPNLDVFNMFNSVALRVERQTTGWRDGAQRPWINSVTLPNVCLAGCAGSAGIPDDPIHRFAKQILDANFRRNYRIVSDRIGIVFYGRDMVSFVDDQRRDYGSLAQASIWNGGIWLFKNADNKRKFDLNPSRYLPKYGGYCTYCLAEGHPGSTPEPSLPDYRANGSIYLFSSDLNYSWEIDFTTDQQRAAQLQKADQTWASMTEDQAEVLADTPWTLELEKALSDVRR